MQRPKTVLARKPAAWLTAQAQLGFTKTTGLGGHAGSWDPLYAQYAASPSSTPPTDRLAKRARRAVSNAGPA